MLAIPITARPQASIGDREIRRAPAPDQQGCLMIDLQKEIELLEQQGNDAELLSLLSHDPNARARHRALAAQFRMLAVQLRYKTRAQAA